jgi:tetratricopeptide (TPR) repeat protein
MHDAEPSPTPEDAGTRVAPAGVVALVLLSGLFAVWAWQYGGWFGSALYPGTVVLAAGLMLLALFAPASLRLRGWPAAALGGLTALGLWSALSALWSPAPEIALEDSQRILTYAMAFGVGLWMCALLGSRIHLAMVPLGFAGLFAGALAVGTMLTGADPGRILDEGTLQYPTGYRNANAAFFLIAAWPAIGLAASRELDWRFRALSLGTATMCLQLGLLAQSRGSMIAGGVAFVVYVVASRDRARAVLWLLLAAAPALVVLPALTDLYDAAADLGVQATIPELRAAGRAVLLGAGIAIALGAVAALLERRYPARESTLRSANRAVAAGAVGLAATGVVAFVIATGDPIGWIGDRAEEFQSQGSPSESGRSRFNFNAGTERDDLWRVALDDATDDPLLGTGAGGYYYSYLRGRSEDGVESARDAHSVELETLGELGLIGLGLLTVALVGSAAGALRSRHAGAPATALSACALTAGAYWLAHASIDWFWPIPALTAPVLALLGAACAPAILDGRGPFHRGRGRWLITAAAAALALTVVPPYLSERYVDRAFETWSRDPQGAFDDLGRASALNPLDEDPLLAEGAIARAAGERERAIDAFEEAARKRPEEWSIHYFLALLYKEEDPARARSELGIAAELNPLSLRIESARERLDPG